MRGDSSVAGKMDQRLFCSGSEAQGKNWVCSKNPTFMVGRGKPALSGEKKSCEYAKHIFKRTQSRSRSFGEDGC